MNQQIALFFDIDGTLFDSKTKSILPSTKYMLEELRKISRLKVYDTDTNFVLIKLDDDEANSLKLELFEKYNILIRDASNFIGLDKSYIRVAIKSHNDNKVLIESLRKILV